MPRIENYETRKSINVGSPTLIATQRAPLDINAASSVGKYTALADVFGDIGEAAQAAYQKRKEFDDNLWVLNTVSDLRQQSLQSLQQAKDQAQPGANGFAGQFHEQYKANYSAMRQGAPSANAANKFTQAAAQWGDTLFAANIGWEAEQNHAFTISSLEESFAKGATLTAQFPLNYFVNLPENLKAIQAANLDPKIKEQLMVNARKSFSWALVMGEGNQNPVATVARLQSNGYSDVTNFLMDANQANSLLSHFQQVARQQQQETSSSIINQINGQARLFSLGIGKPGVPVAVSAAAARMGQTDWEYLKSNLKPEQYETYVEMFNDQIRFQTLTSAMASGDVAKVRQSLTFQQIPDNWAPHADTIVRVAKQYGIPVEQLAAQMAAENNPKSKNWAKVNASVNSAGAAGMTQMKRGAIEQANKSMGTNFDWNDLTKNPDMSIEAMGAYMGYLMKEFPNLREAQAAYLMGETSFRSHKKRHPTDWAETVPQVVLDYWANIDKNSNILFPGSDYPKVALDAGEKFEKTLIEDSGAIAENAINTDPAAQALSPGNKYTMATLWGQSQGLPHQNIKGFSKASAKAYASQINQEQDIDNKMTLVNTLLADLDKLPNSGRLKARALSELADGGLDLNVVVAQNVYGSPYGNRLIQILGGKVNDSAIHSDLKNEVRQEMTSNAAIQQFQRISMLNGGVEGLTQANVLIEAMTKLAGLIVGTGANPNDIVADIVAKTLTDRYDLSSNSFMLPTEILSSDMTAADVNDTLHKLVDTIGNKNLTSDPLLGVWGGAEIANNTIFTDGFWQSYALGSKNITWVNSPDGAGVTLGVDVANGIFIPLTDKKGREFTLPWEQLPAYRQRLLVDSKSVETLMEQTLGGEYINPYQGMGQ
jgi:hypothetical protein